MNKLSPKSVAQNFEAEMDALLSYHSRATAAFVGSATAAADISLMNEQLFLFAAISFESALSDLYFAYVNKDSSAFVAAKEQKIKKHVEEAFGPWYSAKVSIPHSQHISAGELYPLLDPRGFNVTFQNTRRMVAQARKNLLPEYAAKYTHRSHPLNESWLIA